MEKRALVAVAISLAIIVLYQEALRRFYPPPAGETAVSETPSVPSAQPPSAELPQPAAQPPAAVPRAGVSPAAAAAERHVAVETDVYKASFTSLGARLESFELKKYRTTVDPNSPPLQTVVPGQAGELPLGVELRGAQVAPLDDAGLPYTIDKGGLSLTGSQSDSIAFVAETSGITIRKRFTFTGDHYEFTAAVELSNVPKEYAEAGITWFRTVDPRPQPGVPVLLDHTVFLDGRKLYEDAFDKLSAGKVATGDIVWAGYGGRYFLSAHVPLEPRNPRLWLKLRDLTVEQTLLFPVPPGGTIALPMEVYVGPKDFDLLEKVGHNLSRAINLGWFGFIAVPLLHILAFSHGFTGNYGIDVILLTVLIKVLFIPLTQRSFRSMREMQKLQPQMTKIRERFKDDTEQMNKEIMELYRRHKVNPLGGCLPMVLQIPVFIGLYSALQNAVELRHAPFLLWINDLSAPDRLGSLQLPFVQHPGLPVLTLLMGASMFIQQWMTPSAGDPAQQRVMMIMPLMFTFMFVNFPSGLALYWLVNNVLTIAQQYYINRTAT